MIYVHIYLHWKHVNYITPSGTETGIFRKYVGQYYGFWWHISMLSQAISKYIGSKWIRISHDGGLQLVAPSQCWKITDHSKYVGVFSFEEIAHRGLIINKIACCHCPFKVGFTIHLAFCMLCMDADDLPIRPLLSLRARESYTHRWKYFLFSMLICVLFITFGEGYKSILTLIDNDCMARWNWHWMKANWDLRRYEVGLCDFLKNNNFGGCRCINGMDIFLQNKLIIFDTFVFKLISNKSIDSKRLLHSQKLLFNVPCFTGLDVIDPSQWPALPRRYFSRDLLSEAKLAAVGYAEGTHSILHTASRDSFLQGSSAMFHLCMYRSVIISNPSSAGAAHPWPKVVFADTLTFTNTRDVSF